MTMLIIIGLVFDIIGAFLIIIPILRWKRRWTAGELADEMEPRGKWPKLIKERRRANFMAWTGVGLLGFGFFLQILGNLIQESSSG